MKIDGKGPLPRDVAGEAALFVMRNGSEGGCHLEEKDVNALVDKLTAFADADCDVIMMSACEASSVLDAVEDLMAVERRKLERLFNRWKEVDLSASGSEYVPLIRKSHDLWHGARRVGKWISDELMTEPRTLSDDDVSGAVDVVEAMLSGDA